MKRASQIVGRLLANSLNITLAVLMILSVACGQQQQKSSHQSVVEAPSEKTKDLPQAKKEPAYDRIWTNEDLEEFHEDFSFIGKNGKMGVINRTANKVIVPPVYDSLDFSRLHSDWLWASRDGKEGCIDFEARAVFAFVYDSLRRSAMADEWRFCKNGKWGLVEPGDVIVIPAEYDDIRVFKNGLAPVKRDGKWGFVDKNNNPVVPFRYDTAEVDEWGITYEDEVANVTRDGKSFWIDKNGKENPIND